MLWRSKVGFISLILALTSPGCSTTNSGPVRAAEIFLELSASASTEQFLNLHDAIRTKLCASDQSALQDKAQHFSENLNPSIRETMTIRESDLITKILMPLGVDTESGQITKASAGSARVSFRIQEPDKEVKALALSMVLEKNEWKVCNIIQQGFER